MAALQAWKLADLFLYAVPVFENYPPICARNYRPSFHENQPKMLVFYDWNEHFGLVFTKTGSINSGTGVFCIGAIFNLLLFTFLSRSSSLWIVQEKKSGYFVTGLYLKMVILPNRSIALLKAGYFVIGIYLKRVISYYIIDQSRFFKGHFDLGYSVVGLFYTC